MRRFAVLFTLLTTALALSASLGVSHAQYPTPVGNVTASVAAPVTTVGGETVVTCEVRDRAGALVAGATCTFSIVSEPGNDAAVGSKVVDKTTGSDGRATTVLYAGTTPGVIIVRAQSGQLSSNVIVNVGSVAPPPPAAPIAVTPPSTGDGGLVGAR